MPKSSNFQIYTLNNGLRIWYAPNKRSKRLNIGFWTLGGMSTETFDTLEYYHFMEHMAADFTSNKYPNGSDNNRDLKTLGVDLEGEVRENTMHVWMEGHARAADTMIDMCINTVLDYKIDPRRLEQERESIVTELNSYMNDPFYVVDEYRDAKLKPNHVSSATLKQRIKSTKAATAKQLVDFFKKAFTAERTIVYVSGYLPNAEKTLKMMKRKLSKMKKHKPLVTLDQLKAYKPNVKIEPGVHDVFQSDAYTYRIELIWPINITAFHKDQQYFEALELILKTKLFDLLRIQLGMIYHVKLSNSHYDIINPHLSHFEIEMEVSLKRHIKPTIKNTLDFLANHVANITETELLQAKREYANIYEDKKLNCNLDRWWDYAPDLLMHEPVVSFAKQNQRFQRLKLDKLHDVIDKYLDTDAAYVLVCKPRPKNK